MYTLLGNSFNDKHEQVDTKSNQWFGATVASAGVDGPLVVSRLACGPLFPSHAIRSVNGESQLLSS